MNSEGIFLAQSDAGCPVVKARDRQCGWFWGEYMVDDKHYYQEGCDSIKKSLPKEYILLQTVNWVSIALLISVLEEHEENVSSKAIIGIH